MFLLQREKIRLVRLEIPFSFLNSEIGFDIKQNLKLIYAIFWVIEDNNKLRGVSNKLVDVNSLADEEIIKWLIKDGYTEKPLNKAKDNQITQVMAIVDTKQLIDTRLYKFTEGVK